jgi:hypothetical protein
MGSPPERAGRRMLSWTKRRAVAGALAQRSRGIDCSACVGGCDYELSSCCRDLLGVKWRLLGWRLRRLGSAAERFLRRVKIRHDVSSEALEIGLPRLAPAGGAQL